jgi:hypothetical protein
MDHNLHAIASPALIAVPNELEVGGGVVRLGKITAHQLPLKRRI